MIAVYKSNLIRILHHQSNGEAQRCSRVCRETSCGENFFHQKYFLIMYLHTPYRKHRWLISYPDSFLIVGPLNLFRYSQKWDRNFISYSFCNAAINQIVKKSMMSWNHN